MKYMKIVVSHICHISRGRIKMDIWWQLCSNQGKERSKMQR